jgi:hypothetical protein
MIDIIENIIKASYRRVIGVICEDYFCEEKLYVEYLERKTVTVCASRSVARRRLVETENSNACATVNCNWCKREIALYCLCVSVIKRECVIQLLINPIV